MTIEIRSFEDLKNYLRAFTTWDRGEAYDCGGIFILIGALIDNLRKNAVDGDLEDLNGYFDEDQKEYMRRFSEFASRPDID